MKKTTRPWIKNAEYDWVMAQKLITGPKSINDGVCFHCQQCAEKYLKALMEENGLNIPKIHDLTRILQDLTPIIPLLKSLTRGTKFLTNYAVTIRYPGDNASKRQAAAAVRWADKVRSAARNLLGLKPKTK